MAIGRSSSCHIKIKIHPFDGVAPKNCMNYHFPIQITPPLSLQQYARAFSSIPGAEQWHSPGIYRPPTCHSYLSPQIRKKSDLPAVTPWIYSYRRKHSIPTYSIKPYKDKKLKPSEPIWHPPGRYRNRPPTSLSPEKRWQKPIHEPIWQPNGAIQYKSLPYFDPPNLRWSLQQLLKSVPDLQTKPLHTSKTKD